MERSGTRGLTKRIAVAAASTLGVLLALWLPLLAYVHCGGMKEWRSVAASWVTGEETRRLMRLHGAAVLKITQDRVYIWRASRWMSGRTRGFQYEERKPQVQLVAPRKKNLKLQEGTTVKEFAELISVKLSDVI